MAKGFDQIPAVDYDEIFAPEASYTTFRALLAFEIVKGYETQSVDANNVFLIGELKKDVFVEIPFG